MKHKHQHFGFGILTLNPAHIITALRFGVNIGHNLR